MVRVDIQRQGNCTKRSFGRSCQRRKVKRSIKAVTTAARSRSALQILCCVGETPGCAFSRRVAMAAVPVKTMRATAMVEAMKLKKVCSGSLTTV